MSRRTILITGGAGFIGSHLAERLLRDGHRVVAVDNFDAYYDPAVKRDNVAACAAQETYRLVEADIRDSAAMDGLLGSERFDAVVHLAARAGVRPSIADPVLYSSVNLDGTTRLLEACRNRGVRRFVFGSSSSVYGNNDKVPFSEDDPVDHPISPYAATKKAGELLCYSYHHLFGMAIACLRFFTVYGPRQRPEMAIHKFARLLAAGQEIEQFGDGGTARDYTYVDDIVEGIVLALDACRGYHVWNLGGSRTITLADLIAELARQMRVEPRVRRLPPQAGDVQRTWADVTRARRELRWTPRIEMRQGIRLFLDWFEAGRDSRRPAGRHA